jgi:hypothetical protein
MSINQDEWYERCTLWASMHFWRQLTYCYKLSLPNRGWSESIRWRLRGARVREWMKLNSRSTISIHTHARMLTCTEAAWECWRCGVQPVARLACTLEAALSVVTYLGLRRANHVSIVRAMWGVWKMCHKACVITDLSHHWPDKAGTRACACLVLMTQVHYIWMCIYVQIQEQGSHLCWYTASCATSSIKEGCVGAACHECMCYCFVSIYVNKWSVMA